MMTRTMDARFLNQVANRPDVRPYIGGVGTLDLQPFLDNAANVALACDLGGFIAIKVGDGLYEVHSLFTPDGSGASALAAMREGQRYLFTKTDCLEIVTKCPEGNGAALGAARIMGLSSIFELEQGWELENGSRGKFSCYSLSLSKWIQRDLVAEEKGIWFHKRLEELTEASGAKIPVHFEERAHNCAVGASVLMFESGQTQKAVWTYNRWAAIAGFPPITLMSISPVVVDMDQVVVGIADGDMEILRCR